MVTVNYQTLSDVMNFNVGSGTGYDISAESIETLLDLSIDMLNLFGAELPNMTGTAGAKTVSLTSPEKAAVLLVARAVYNGFYRSTDQAALGGASVSTTDLMKDPATLQLVKDAARELQQKDASDEGYKVYVG